MTHDLHTHMHQHTLTHMYILTKFISWRHNDDQDIIYMKNALLQLGHSLSSQHSGGLSVGGQPGSMAGPPAALESLFSQIEDPVHATLAGRGTYHHTPFRGEPEAQTRF